jgi:class 3 adenylate cyclase
MKNYVPRPLDTSRIHVSAEMFRLVDLFAENAHEIWAQERMSEGWHYGALRDEAARKHPCLIPYRDLPASEQDLNRKTALETIKTLISLGFRKESPNSETKVVGSNLEEKAQAVLAGFKNPAMTLPELRRQWEERMPLIWFQNVQIYRRAVDVALRLGESFIAFDMSVEGLQAFHGDLRLIQLQALALARTGATSRANLLLEHLRSAGHEDEETLGILARTHKDFWQLAIDPEEKRQHLKTSFEFYLDGYKRNRGYYSGINAATMGLIYGEKDISREIAREVCEICLTTLDFIGPESGERYWLEATLAEAALLLGDMEMAEEYYQRGSNEPGMSPVVISRTRSQARLLLDHLRGEPHLLDHCFHLPRISVFSGHMFDRADRARPRFPASLERLVRAELKEKLDTLNVQVGYSSLACGGDLIFCEALLERGGEINIVLPFRTEDFKQVSVEIVPGTNWGERFDHILQNAATVTVLNEQGDANDGAAYEFCNQALSGLALLKSQFLGMDVAPLVLWDGCRGDGRGGTQSFYDFWKQKRGAEVEVINPVKFLPAQPAEEPAAPTEPQTGTAPEGEGQQIKAMIFADIVGFTKLQETQIPAFVTHFMGKVAELMERMKNPPLHRNTWGDAIFCVFDHVADAGVFALDLRDLVRMTDWTEWGLPTGLSIRIALHAGPVFACYDPVLKKLVFNGSHVNRTARIEPIAEEGQVYASEAFAALSAADGVAEFKADYVGTKQLAKKYGAIPVFLVRRTI